MNKRQSFLRVREENEKLEREANDFTAARHALDAYPRLQASADFDQRVLARMAASRTPLELFCDHLDAVFARPLYKLLGSALFGLIFSGICIGFVLLPQLLAGASAEPSTPVTVPTPRPVYAGNVQTLGALDEQFALYRSFQEEMAIEKPVEPSHKNPAERRRSSWENVPSEQFSLLSSGSLC